MATRFRKPSGGVTALIIGQVFFLILALLLGMLVATPAFATFSVDLPAWGIGVATALALILVMETVGLIFPRWVNILSRQAAELFQKTGVDLTLGTILALSLAAGICEELLFRGVIQAGLDKLAPAAFAIIIASALFGLAHAAYSSTYVLTVAFVSVVLGAAFAWTDNIMTAIIAHALYDIYALFRLKRWMRRARMII